VRKPITIVTGVHPDAMTSAVLSLAWDLPDTVVVRHRIDLERCALERVVSDVTGIVEHESIDLEHAASRARSAKTSSRRSRGWPPTRGGVP
jgi:hypothetical protein